MSMYTVHANQIMNYSSMNHQLILNNSFKMCVDYISIIYTFWCTRRAKALINNGSAKSSSKSVPQLGGGFITIWSPKAQEWPYPARKLVTRAGWAGGTSSETNLMASFEYATTTCLGAIILINFFFLT